MSEAFETGPLTKDIVGARQDLGNCGNTKIYELISAGHLDARKIGKKTVITTASIREYLAALPKADIRMSRKAA